MAGLDPDLSSYAGYGQTNKLLATASNSPDNLNQWLTVGRQQQALQQGQVQLQTQQQGLSQQKLAGMQGIISSVMANPSPDNASARITDGIKYGVMSPEDSAHELMMIQAMSASQDPSKPNPRILDYARVHGVALQAVNDQMAGAYGNPTLVDQGGSINPYTVKPASSGAPGYSPAPGGVGAIPKSQNPDALGDMVTVPGANGVSTTMTKAQAQQAAGYSGMNNPNSYVDPRRAATAGVSIVNGHPVYGAQPSSIGPPTPAGTQPGDVLPNGPVGGRAGSNSRGSATAGPGINGATPVPQGSPQIGIPGPSPMLGAGLKAYQDDQANASAKMEGVRSLTQALPLVQQLGATGSGPGTAAFQKAKSTLVSLGVLSPDTSDVTAYDEAKKYLSAYVSKSTLAGRSDMGQLQAQASSPNLETSNAATLALARNAVAFDRVDVARPSAWNGGDNLAGYGAFKAGFTQNQDPRAYQIDLLPQAQRQALLADMKSKQTTPEGQRFWSSLQNAHNAQVLTGLPTGGAGVQQ